MAAPERASLQMYLRPETATATRAFWAGIRAAYGAGEVELKTYDPTEQAWRDPALLLSQTCGLPYRLGLKDHVRIVGTPDYGIPNSPPGHYYSCLLARADDPRNDLANFRGATLAVNGFQSQSGWAAIENHLTETGAGFSFRADATLTGSHVGSARAVAEGRADIASLDAVTWAHCVRYDGFAAKLRVITTTRPTPGLPLITGKSVDPAPLFAAIQSAIDALSPEHRNTLMLRGLVKIPETEYLAVPIPDPPGPAARTGAAG